MNRLIKFIVIVGAVTLAFGSCSDQDPKPVEKKLVAHVETYAGSTEGFEDGPLRKAKFKWPSQIVTTSAGGFYVLDQNNTAVRKITPDGMVSTVFSGESYNRYCIAIDENDVLYITHDMYILKVDDTGVTEVIANGLDYIDERYFHAIYGMAFHPDGYLYAAESGNARIMKISKAGEVSLYAGGQQGYVDGDLASAKFGAYQGMLIAPNGDFYLSDSDNYKFRKISGGQVTTIAGTIYGYRDGPALTAQFGNPHYMARTHDGTIYVTGTEQYIRKISPEGQVSTIAGSLAGFKDGVDSNAQFFNPSGLALDTNESLYVADYGNNLIRKIVFKLE